MVRSLALVLYGNNPRIPWKPSTAMLDNRLTGTRDARRLTATNPLSLVARSPPDQPRRGPHPTANLRASRCAEGAA
jgi:hypothetical protein